MTRKWTAFTILTIGLVALLAAGAMVASAQDDDTPPCDFDGYFGSGHMMGGRGGMMGNARGGMMGNNHGGMMGGNYSDDCLRQDYYGMGMMGGYMGMFGGQNFDFDNMGRFGPGAGMMGAWEPPADLAPSGDTLTLDEAVKVADAYIAAWDSDRALELGEVMQFDNHFYAAAVEAETGRGAFEFLIDPTSGYVIGEPGPNMMWNLKYGMEMGRGMGFFRPADTDAPDMTVSAEQARTNAQAYLDDVLPGATVDPEDADTFYGYYTLHVMQDGDVIGMLGVNGYTGQVWLHHWHGDFITMTSHE